MLRPLEFSPAIESMVRFVEDTAPENIVAATAAKLEQGVLGIDLLRGAALAVTRSTDLPADHHGGPVHPVAGMHSVNELCKQLKDKWSKVPVIQSVALANRHIHSPEMGPALMAALAPEANLPADSVTAREQFAELIQSRHATAAERYMIGLLQAGRTADALVPMLECAVRRNSLDDHYLLYLVHTVRSLDDLGWEWAGTLLRLPLRYLASNPLMDAAGEFGEDYIRGNVHEYQSFGQVEALIDRHALVEDKLRIETGVDETRVIEELGARVGAMTQSSAVSDALAVAMSDGLSVKGAAEALSYAAGLLSLRITTANPFDVHMHTGLNPRRFLLDREDLPVRLRVLLVLSWAHGPEVRLPMGNLKPVQTFEDTLPKGHGLRNVAEDPKRGHRVPTVARFRQSADNRRSIASGG